MIAETKKKVLELLNEANSILNDEKYTHDVYEETLRSLGDVIEEVDNIETTEK